MRLNIANFVIEIVYGMKKNVHHLCIFNCTFTDIGRSFCAKFNGFWFDALICQKDRLMPVKHFLSKILFAPCTSNRLRKISNNPSPLFRSFQQKSKSTSSIRHLYWLRNVIIVFIECIFLVILQNTHNILLIL